MEKFKEIERDEDYRKHFQKSFMNNVYMVDVRMADEKEGMKGHLWLSIKRKDKSWIRDWREMQKIKNMIAGEEREGCEIYPAESRLVDTSNQFHIFVLPENEKMPFGYKDRLVCKGHKGGWQKGSSQRDFKKKDEPEDAKNVKEIDEMARGIF